jgi:diguanylate cyclase (GGDEF)-like protein
MVAPGASNGAEATIGFWSKERGSRTARRNWMASIGLVVTLLGISLFALWSSHATSVAADHATAASRLSDDYSAASSAVADEEALEQQYRLTPARAVWTDFNAASAKLVQAMTQVRADGGPADWRLSPAVLADHGTYLGAVIRLFDAVDQHRPVKVAYLDHKQADPAYASVELAVDTAADLHHRASLAQLAHLQHLQKVTSRLTPLVFILGLLIAAALASVTRGFQRLRNLERAQAIHDSLHDALTGLPNRKLLDDRLTQALQAADRDETRVGLLLIDLDRFKEINDTFGHQFGDILLSQVGRRLTHALRDVDTVARLGGDEFAILLPTVVDVSAANLVAGKLQLALDTPFRVENVDFDVEASMGLVVSGAHGLEAELLLQRADIAMYVAKTQNLGVFAYDPAVDGHSPAKLALLGDLRRALGRDELVLHYQPKISISTGDVVGVEALVRWEHPVRGLVQPDEFIPVAEHTGLIGPLMRYVLDRALRQSRIWADSGRPMKVAVNLSARNLLDEGLPATVQRLLTVHAVPANMLELEVTESALMTEPGRAQFLLEQLAGLGVRISIDDFGAGYTSLGQLKDLPVTELKIDRSFVTNMTEERNDALIVRSVVELGHNLGLTIVAEGVETLEALNELREFGCDVAQGYHLSKPMPVNCFDDWYLTRPIVMFEPDPGGGGTMIQPVDLAQSSPPRPRYG